MDKLMQIIMSLVLKIKYGEIKIIIKDSKVVRIDYTEQELLL